MTIETHHHQLASPSQSQPVLKANVIKPIRLIQDIAFYILATIIINVLRFFFHPYQKVFYCDDDAIRYPYMPDIVSDAALMTTSIMLPVAIIFGVEVMRLRRIREIGRVGDAADDKNGVSIEIIPDSHWRAAIGTTYFGNQSISPLLCGILQQLGTFSFGLLACIILTFIGKLTSGELRPHFIDVCQPAWNETDCAQAGRYFDASICRGDPAAIMEGRQSFPSGHSSISAYAATFLIIYVSGRTAWNSRRVGRDEASSSTSQYAAPILHCVFVTMALFCGLSRVADNHHRLIDVICGWILGCVSAVVFCYHGKLM